MKSFEVRPNNKSETAIVRVYVRLRTVQYIYYGTVVLDSFVCCSVAFVAVQYVASLLCSSLSVGVYV